MPEVTYADLSVIQNALSTIHHNVGVLDSNLGIISEHQLAMADRQAAMESELQRLIDQFLLFIAEDKKHKGLQLAETRVGNLRQELQIKFGYYAEIRRMATGILQGIETGVVDNETVKTVTEEATIKAPGYWLAPVLVTCASWMRDDKETCDKALRESLQRDDYKSTLFFMLLTRRLGRNDASVKWLERYFLHQNPHDLDREFLTVLEAVTTGVFQPAARAIMMKYVGSWLAQLTQGDEFVNEQKSQWMKFFQSSKPQMAGDKYPLLRKFAGNWPQLEHALCTAMSQEVLHDHFRGIVSSSQDYSSTTKSKLDEILTLLVTNFDDEELPLQKQVRLNQLIIERNGDQDSAQAVLDAEENIFEEKVDFLQILTNAAFNAEAAGVTRLTQALAVSISLPWIVTAYDVFTAQYRSQFPQTAQLKIDDFAAASKDGGDENELVTGMETYYSNLREAAMAEISVPVPNVVIGVLIGLAGFLFVKFAALVPVISIAIGATMIWNAVKGVNKKKAAVASSLDERRRKSVEVLRGCLAELVDYRKELAHEDSKGDKVTQLLASIAPQDFSSVSREASRNLV